MLKELLGVGADRPPLSVAFFRIDDTNEAAVEQSMAGGPLSDVFDRLRLLSTDVDDAARVDAIRALEELKAAAAAAQARMVVAFADSQRTTNLAAEVTGDDAETGITHQVGSAMRVSPQRARRCVNWALLVTTQLPEAFAELRAGRTSEYRSVLVAQHAAWLGAADRPCWTPTPCSTPPAPMAPWPGTPRPATLAATERPAVAVRLRPRRPRRTGTFRRTWWGVGTSIANAQGLCQACNYAKEAEGWRFRLAPGAGSRTTIGIITPTGHRYRSRAPVQLHRPRESVEVKVETWLDRAS